MMVVFVIPAAGLVNWTCYSRNPIYTVVYDRHNTSLIIQATCIFCVAFLVSKWCLSGV